jgi:NADP-dependent 3-hydroxy acid dehydrogenase YdfG
MASSSTVEFPLQDQVMIVAGASSGIGVAIAHALYAKGAKVCIGARRLEKLEEVATQCRAKYPNSPGSMICVACDVTDRSSVQAMVRKTCEDEFKVDSVRAMICCAGVMYFTKMKNAQMDEWDNTINVNCRGVTNCFGSVIPNMVQAGCGKIITISSDAGVRDFPCLAVYCASKAFVETLTEITRRELVGTGVTLTTIQPGDVKGTELVMRNTDQEAADQMGVQIGQPCGTGFDRNQLLDPEDVADAVVYVLTAPSHVGINTIMIEARDQA